MKGFTIKKLLCSTLFATIFSGIKADSDYLKDTDRGSLFLKTDFNVAKFDIQIDKSQLDTLIESANTVYENENQEAKVKGKLKISISENEVYEDADTQYGIGGQSTRGQKKLNLNVKLDKKQLDRKNIRLRASMFDPSFLRIKLSSDILNRLGLKSVSSNYVDVFINGDYMGLYVLSDIYKNSWLKEYYKLKNDPSYQFYQCKEKCDLTANNAKLCVSDSDSDELAIPIGDDEDPNRIPDENVPLLEFMNAINEKKTVDELKEFMDVDAFIKSWIFEWLIGSVDHMLVNGKNYYLFRYNGIWIPLIYDFDTTFGLDNDGQIKSKYGSKPTEVGFEDWYDKRFIVDLLTKGDNEKLFLSNLQEVIDKAFNPDLLFPHIDALKSWIDSYVKKDRTPNKDGELPGRINNKATYDFDEYTYDDFKKNSEYTTINNVLGIKQWIADRYKFACNKYNIKCQSKFVSLETTTTPKTTTTTTTTPKITTTTTTTPKITTTTTTTPKITTTTTTTTTPKITTTTTTTPKFTTTTTTTTTTPKITTTTTTTPKITTTTTTTTPKITTTTTTTTTTGAKETVIDRCGDSYGQCSEGYC